MPRAAPERWPLDARRKVLGYGVGAHRTSHQMDRYPGDQFPLAAFFWPASVAASAAETASSVAAHLLGFSADAVGAGPAQEPEGATPSTMALELHTVRLRDFTVGRSGVPTLLCPPLALHGAAVADLATGHSLVAALRGAGIERLFMADWRSASADMRFLGSRRISCRPQCPCRSCRRPGRSRGALPGRLVIPGLCGTIPGQGTQACHGRRAD